MTPRARATPALILALAFVAGCAATVAQTGATLQLRQVGVASYYASRFEGHPTASGGTYHAHRLTAAHRTLPMGTRVRVTNLENGRSVVVTITDRGPFKDDRIIDVSWRAARKLGFERAGTARVRLTVLLD
ncbi:MAG TPA: septal ring lytic transglycosylase RlpA family protein [Candidatus Eisenbacteria bacterium]